MDFVAPADQRENPRKRKKRRVFRPCQRTKKAVEHVGDGDINCNWRAWNGPQRPGGGGWQEELGSKSEQRLSSIVEIVQNTEKSPGDSRKLIITQMVFF